MANSRPTVDRGLMSVPRSFPADQYAFLVKLLAYMQRLGGNIRGDNPNRAVRRSEMSAFSDREIVIREGGVAARQLADGAVTTEKLADNAVTGKKLEQGSVTEREIRAGAVTTAGLAAGSVTWDKLAPGLVSFVSGEAADGETIRIPGQWLFPPLIAMTSIMLPAAGTTGRVGALNPRAGEEDGTWEFDAAGNFGWFAVGCARGADDAL